MLKLFIGVKALENGPTLDWINITTISDLKAILAEVIIVKFLEVILLSLDNLTWPVLILPISIALLASGLKILGLRKTHYLMSVSLAG